MKGVIGIDPDGSSLQAIRDIDGSGEIFGVEGSSKTVNSVVSDSNSIIGSLKFGDGSNRPENLFLHNLHVLLDARKEGGLDEVAFGSMTFSTGFNGSTLLLSVFNIRHDSVELQLGHLGPLESIWMEGVSNYVLLDPLLERCDELFEIVNANSNAFVIRNQPYHKYPLGHKCETQRSSTGRG